MVMSTERSLSERVLDVVVYAPIGLAAHVREQHDAYIAAGRERFEQTVHTARFIGKMALDQGQRELRRRLDRGCKPTSSPTSDAPSATVAESTVAESTVADVTVVDATGAPGATAATLAGDLPVRVPGADAVVVGLVVAEAAALPLADYDSLAASQVVLRLGDLQPHEVDAIGVYESTHRARRTILAKIAQLQGA